MQQIALENLFLIDIETVSGSQHYHLLDDLRTERRRSTSSSSIRRFADDPWAALLPALRARGSPRRHSSMRRQPRDRAPPAASALRRHGAGRAACIIICCAAQRDPRHEPCKSSIPARSTRSPAATRTSSAARRGCSTRSSSASPTAKSKRPFFSTDERIAMAREVLRAVSQRRGARLFGAADGFRPRAGRAGDPARAARGVRLRVRVPDGRNEPQPLSRCRNAVPDARRAIHVHFGDDRARDRPLRRRRRRSSSTRTSPSGCAGRRRTDAARARQPARTLWR